MIATRPYSMLFPDPDEWLNVDGLEVWKTLQPLLIAEGYHEVTMEQLLLATKIGDLITYRRILPFSKPKTKRELEEMLIKLHSHVLEELEKYSISPEILKLMEIDDSG